MSENKLFNNSSRGDGGLTASQLAGFKDPPDAGGGLTTSQLAGFRDVLTSVKPLASERGAPAVRVAFARWAEVRRGSVHPCDLSFGPDISDDEFSSLLSEMDGVGDVSLTLDAVVAGGVLLTLIASVHGASADDVVAVGNGVAVLQILRDFEPVGWREWFQRFACQSNRRVMEAAAWVLLERDVLDDDEEDLS